MSSLSIIEKVVERILGEDIETVRCVPLSTRKHEDCYHGLQVSDRNRVLTSQQVNRMVDEAIGYNN